MVQNFVTVCVVCMLCAAHTPCAAHTDLSMPHYAASKQNFNLTNHSNQIETDISDPRDRLPLDSVGHVAPPGVPGDSFGSLSGERSSGDPQQVTRELEKRPKNGESGTANRPRRFTDKTKESVFVRQLFKDFGDGENMTIVGFEKLLNTLGITSLIAAKEEVDDLDKDKSGDAVVEESLAKHHSNKSKHSKEKCLNSNELLSTLSQDKLNDTSNGTVIPAWLFERVCPALIFQLTAKSAGKHDCVQIPDNYTHLQLEDYKSDDMTNNSLQVWVYSSISILVISVCGLFGVAVIPIMGKSYYHQLLQFLVALAVGTLCGDALIHLLPHAMMMHPEHGSSSLDHESAHNLNMWKGFAAMIGLVLFFFTEKGLNMIAEWRKQRQRRSKLPARVKVMRETEVANSNTTVGEKLCKHKYSSYPYCYGEIATENQDNHQHNHKPVDEEKPLTSHCNSVLKIMDAEVEKKEVEDWKLDDGIIKKNVDSADMPYNENESYTVILREHETKHHGHTHSHGHVHSAPESMSNVAWMVVMGDGLHNFTDGMAIGAAFSANIGGGFSTAIAVFCHELPHELGDFAVLLKAGMSAKQAVFYNLLSSVLCLFGMIFGILLGSTPAMSSWIFSGAAGMFIYIALVDMIPELSSNHSAEKGTYWHCLLQGLGLVTGLSIMLIIALYEHDLKHIFGE